MSKVVNKVMRKVSPIADKLSFGATKIVDNALDKYAGTDIGGFKEAQRIAKEAEAAQNQANLNSQLNANIIGSQGVDNVVQVEAGGSAADASMSTDSKKRRAGTISSTLGI